MGVSAHAQYKGLLLDYGHAVPDDLINFGRALDDAEVLTDGWFYFLARPDKWADEFYAWKCRFCPMQGDATWQDWLDDLERMGA